MQAHESSTSCREPLRSAVRRELERPDALVSRRRNVIRLWSLVLAVSLLAAVAGDGARAAAAALPRYEQAVLPGLAGFDLGFDSSPAVADLDGDGDLDVVVGSRHTGLKYLTNTGSSAAPAFVGLAGAGNPFSGTSAGLIPGRPALADLDGDGDLDAVVGGALGALDYFENTGSPTAPAFVTGGAGNPFTGIDIGGYSQPALVDLDGDGDLDAVVGESEGGLHYLRNTGSSSSPVYLEVTGTANPFATFAAGSASAPGLADLDADGDPDAVVGNGSTSLFYLRNTGSSTAPAFVMLTGTANPFSGLAVSFLTDPWLADVDGDGDLDAVVGEYFGTLRYLRNSGTSMAPVYVGVTDVGNPFAGADVGFYSSPAVADVDGDGDVDSVVGDYVGTLRYFRNTGSPAAPMYLEAAGSGNLFAAIDVGDAGTPTLADMDGDGDLDAAVGENDGTLTYLRNTGSSTEPAYVQVTGTASPLAAIDVGLRSAPALTDVDGDGDRDLLVGESTGTLRYFRNTGSATAPAFSEVTGTGHPLAGAMVGNLSSPALADLDEDGDLDAVVGQGGLGDLSLFHNTGSSSAPSYVEVAGTANPFAQLGVGLASTPALADVDGDGDLDVVVGEDGGSLAYLRSRLAVFADGFESGDTSAWSMTVP